MNLDILDNKITIHELSVSSHRPNETPEKQTRSQRHINDDLLLGWLLLIPYSNQVAPTHPPDPPSNVQEQNPRSDELTPVPLVTAHNQMRKPIRPTKQALFSIIVEPTLCLFYWGFDSQSWCTVGCVKLQWGLKLFDLLLFTFGELLGLFAWG